MVQNDSGGRRRAGRPRLRAGPGAVRASCAPQAGVRFCPTVDLTQRVPSWDGTPLDVDVTLPPGGTGPFATIVLEHGYPGTKQTFQSSTPEGNGGAPTTTTTSSTPPGFAVVTLSARGFGRSCGVPESRTAGCERGWTHIADQRYENRDVQHLLGLLVDEGVAARTASASAASRAAGGARSASPSSRTASGSPTAPSRAGSARAARRCTSPPRSRAGAGTTSPRRWCRTAGPQLAQPARRPQAHLDRPALRGRRRRRLPLPARRGPAGRPDQLAQRHHARAVRPRGEQDRAHADPLHRRRGRPARRRARGADDRERLDRRAVPRRRGAADRRPRDGPKLLLGDLGHGWADNPSEIDRASTTSARPSSATCCRRSSRPALSPDVQVSSRAAPRAPPAPSLRRSLGALQRGQVVLRTAARALRLARRSAAAAALNGASGDWCKGAPARREPNAATSGALRGFTLLGSPVLATSRPRRGRADRGAAVGGARQAPAADRARALPPERNQRGRIRFALHPNAYRFAAGNARQARGARTRRPLRPGAAAPFQRPARQIEVVLPTRERGARGFAR